MHNWVDIAEAIGNATQSPFNVVRSVPVGGGDINHAYRLDGADGRSFFVKLNDAKRQAMFPAESAGLDTMARTDTVRVPIPIVHGTTADKAYLVLEQLELRGSGDASQLGEQLAAMHRCTAEQFGFWIDNTIGTTPQSNAWSDGWIAFWREHRLGAQLRLAAKNGYGSRLQELGEELSIKLEEFFSHYQPQPSLLHGDLWGGNHAFLGDGTPVIFDPATYYGDREADIAMTELFGGYGKNFQAAYRAAWPLDEGYATRSTLYNLYHILNHANLFGGGYARQAEHMMQQLLAELR